MDYIKPKILISKCLEFDTCRYDGQLIKNKYVEKLKNYVEFIPICPEIEIGLGVPRDPIQLINNKNILSIHQPSTNKDLSEKMITFSKKFINSINYIDGMILKSKSPTCAINSSKHYSNIKNKKLIKYGPGLFTNHLINEFPNLPKEEDIKLNDIPAREIFYTAIFTIADFRNTMTFKDLYEFHSKNKLLFMSYNQLKLKKLGQIAANHKEKKIETVLDDYYEHLLKILNKKPNHASHVNTQTHAFGFYKKKISKKDKKYFLNLLDEYSNKKIPLSNLNKVLQSWNLKFDNQYLLKQSYFSPYPKELK